jgi:hypothetical protein
MSQVRSDYMGVVLRARSVAIFAVIALLLTASSCSQTIRADSARLDNRNIGTLVVSTAKVLLVPPMGGGEGGWCMTTTPGVCASLDSRAVSDPMIAETWFGQGPLRVDEGVVLTTGEVETVSINGQVVSTRTESVLPDRLRTAVVELRERSLLGPRPRPRFTALDSTGTAIPQKMPPHTQLLFHVPSRMWKSPATEPKGVCQLNTTPFVGLVTEGGSVMTRASPRREMIGREFVSCTSVQYLVKGWPIIAGVLLDASHPGTTPASLPAMQLLQGHPGVFHGPGVEGETVARRIPGAWVLVAKGEGLLQRLTLLEHLHVVVHVM